MRFKLLIGSLVLLAAIAIFSFGLYLGQNKSLPGDQSKADLQRIVDSIYSPPSREMFTLSGVVKGTYGAILKLEVNDPDDYLPHSDGSPRRKEIRSASALGSTTYTLVDHSNGSPVRSAITLRDVKVGNFVLVKSNENIRSAEKFDVTSVEVVRY